MIALIVVSFGLLGVAKLEAVSYSSTSVANKRSLAAFEAASLAAAMHVNRGYWTNTDPAGAIVTLQGTNFTVVTGAANLAVSLAAVAPGPGGTCTSLVTPCAVTDLAAYDLLNWAANLNAVLPNESATIACGAVTPISCTIKISWGESSVATTDRGSAAGSGQPERRVRDPGPTHCTCSHDDRHLKASHASLADVTHAMRGASPWSN